MESAQQIKEGVSGSVSQAMDDLKDTAREAAGQTREAASSAAR